MASAKRSADPQRRAPLYPALAEAAHQTCADALGLIDLTADDVDDLSRVRTAITYTLAGRVAHALTDTPWPRREGATTENAPALSRPGTDDDVVFLSCALKNTSPLPEAVPAFASYSSLALESADEGLPKLCNAVSAAAVPIVMTTWSLSSLGPERRNRIAEILAEAAIQRCIGWVSVEGVGVAPHVSTLGDRPASGHSLIGLVIFSEGSIRATTIGRCWSGGRYLAWFGS